MLRADNAYSRLVVWLKIVLPVIALGLLSSLFLFQQGDDDLQPLPFSPMELEALAKARGIGAPHFTGLTDQGREISLTATTALPRIEDRSIVDVEGLAARLESPANGGISLVGRAATVNQTTALARIRGAVQAQTGTGYRLVTEALDAALDRTDVESQEPVRLTGPGLEIDAGAMTIDPAPGGTGLRVVFKEGVRLVYTPKAR